MNGDVAKQANSVLELYRSGVKAKDVDAFIGLYADDVRVFDAWGTWFYSGVAAWRAVVAEWFGSLGTDTVEVLFSEIRIEAGMELAALNSIVSYTNHSAAGAKLRSMENRITWVLVRRAGAWRIVHEHSSAPIDFADLKAMLHR
jgi:uncharacterized protein (TIGR02246 family)